MIEMNYSFNTKLSFENGLTISFSIGGGNYCSNRINNPDDNPYENKTQTRKSENCEIAIWETKTEKDMNINLFLPEHLNTSDIVIGWVNADDLAIIISNVANYK